VTRRSLQQLRSLSREYDLFAPEGRDWRGLLEGEFHPPLPVAGHSLVWGFGILREAERLGLHDLPCRELEESDPAVLLELALRLENRPARYTWPEQAALYRFLSVSLPPEWWPAAVALITSEQPPKWLAHVASYLEFPPALKRLVDENLLDVKAGAKVRNLPESFFAALSAEKSRFSFSERRLLALSLNEVALRDRLDPAGTEALCRDILGRDDPLAALRLLRFPELTALLERFRQTTADLSRRGVTVSPPEGFEGDTFTFSFTASSRAVYARKTAALNDFEDDVDRLFELL
jgi:hypothetical protein